MTRIEDGRLIVSARITNTSDREMNLRASLLAGGRSPSGRSIGNLPAGATATREFILDHAGKLRGNYLRLTVEQIGGSAKCNQAIRLE